MLAETAAARRPSGLALGPVEDEVDGRGEVGNDGSVRDALAPGLLLQRGGVVRRREEDGGDAEAGGGLRVLDLVADHDGAGLVHRGAAGGQRGGAVLQHAGTRL